MGTLAQVAPQIIMKVTEDKMKTYYVYFHYYWNLCWYEFTNIRKALRFIEEKSKDTDIINSLILFTEKDSGIVYEFKQGKRVR